MEYLAQHIESLIFTCEQPISFKEIKAALEETFEAKIKEEEIKSTITTLMDKYQSDSHAFEIVKIAGGYQFLTKGAFHNTIGTFLKQTIKKRLSRAALETLSIIAYKQPVTKTDIENIRGVNCDYAVQKLLEKELVAITGRKEGPGRPLLYGTSQKFMNYFGIEDIQDLPKIKEFTNTENSIGEAAPIEEVASGNNASTRREDDAVDVAIAVANIYQPLSPSEEENSKDDNSNEEGTPIADPSDSTIEEGAAAEAEEIESQRETESDSEVTTQFVQKTTGEYTGQANEETDTENIEGSSDVIPEGDASSAEED